MRGSLVIEKSGKIKGGNVNYAIGWNDDGTARLSWEADVKVKIGFFTKNFESEGSESVPGEMVKSHSYREAGDKQMYQDVFAISVVNTDGETSVLNLVSRKHKCTGEAVIDVTNTLILIDRLVIKGSAYGMRLTIRAHGV